MEAATTRVFRRDALRLAICCYAHPQVRAVGGRDTIDQPNVWGGGSCGRTAATTLRRARGYNSGCRVGVAGRGYGGGFEEEARQVGGEEEERATI